MGHILEGHHGNIAARLRGPQARRFFAGPVWSQGEQEHATGSASSAGPDPWQASPDPWQTGQDPWQTDQSSWQYPHPSTAGGLMPSSSQAYPAHDAHDAQPAEVASSTDTDTISTLDDLDYAADDLRGLTGPQMDEHLFWEY